MFVSAGNAQADALVPGVHPGSSIFVDDQLDARSM